jgi:eukaryotic-like serine/threonine-protein kinase
MPVEPERWQRLREVFPAALAIVPDERPARLAEVCGADAGLRAEVESLLAAHEAAAGFLSGPGEEELAEASLDGERLGPYRIVNRLGAGGMGVVYLALRADGEFQQRVALKVVKPGLDSVEVIRRFLAERQILAALEHPNIARLLDGGTTERGLPYFVMEYVEGQPIDTYCRERRLSLRQRLELFLTICSAVEHAHRNLIVHRDLKPGNVLVSADGTPKLLDFGIAKLLDPELALSLGATVFGPQPMTPDYASPEQMRGEHVTTASDVYSLGVLLYELLAGRHPFRSRASTPAEMRRLVTEEEPPKPMAGDLDNIVLKALRKEPNRRYGSVEQLADDVRRYLAGRPVLARPGTIGYRASKFLRRHRVGTAIAATILLAIVGFGIGMAALAARLAQERDRAEQQRRRAEQVTAFLTEIFEVSDPLKKTGKDVTARELLDVGAAKIGAQLHDQPETRAALTMTMGSIYRRLALYDRAIPLLESALSTRLRVSGEAREVLAQNLDELGTARLERGETAAAAAAYNRSLEIRRRLFGAEHLAVAMSLNNLANVQWAKAEYAAAEPLYVQVLEMRRRLLSEEHEDVATSLNNLGNVAYARGDPGRAEPLHREALRIRRKLLGDDHVDVGESENNLAAVLSRRGELAEARALYEAAIAVRRSHYGNEHPIVIQTLGNLAVVLHDQGDDAAAEPLYRQVLAYSRKTFGDHDLEVARAANNLAGLRRDQGAWREARQLYGEAIAILREKGGPRHPNLGTALTSLAELEVTHGEFAAAEPKAREALAILQAAYPPGHWRTAAAESVLGGCLLGRGRLAEAERLLLHSQPILASASERSAAIRNRETLRRLADVYVRLGRRKEAVKYREMWPSLKNSS